MSVQAAIVRPNPTLLSFCCPRRRKCVISTLKVVWQIALCLMNIVCRNIRRKRTCLMRDATAIWPHSHLIQCCCQTAGLSPSLTHYLSQTEHQWCRQPQLSGPREGSPEGQSPPHQSPGMMGCYFQSQVTLPLYCVLVDVPLKPTKMNRPLPSFVTKRTHSPGTATPPNTSESSLWLTKYMTSTCMNHQPDKKPP